MLIWESCILSTYRWYEDQYKDSSCYNKQSEGSQCNIRIDQVYQNIECKQQYNRSNTGYINGRDDVNSIIETFDLYLANGDGKNESYNLQQDFVAIQYANCDIFRCRVAHENPIAISYLKYLGKR